MQKSPCCPSCQCIYSTKDVGPGWQHKNPLLLNCGHTFCAGCLTKIAHKDKTSITCPTCKVYTPLPADSEGNVRSLHPDLYVTGCVVCTQRSLLNHELGKLKPAGMMFQHATKHLTEKQDRLCRECTMRVAICKCDRCDFIMCAHCFQKIHASSNLLKIHSSSNALKQHQALPLDSLKEDEEISVECREHPNRMLEYFCEEDNIAICSKCVIEGLHKSHAIVSMEEKNKTVLMDMEPALNTANRVLKKLKIAGKSVKEFMPDIKQETYPVLQEIHEHFQILHGILQARENKLREDVIALYKKGTEPLLNLKTQMQEESEKLELAIKAAQRILNNNNEVVLNAKDILDQLTRAQVIPCIIQPKVNGRESDTDGEGRISFQADTSIQTNILSYGSIGGGVLQRAEWHTIQEAPEGEFEDSDSSRGVTTPQDTLSMADTCSVVSNTDTASSEDVIIEDEQEVIVGGVETRPKQSGYRHNAARENKTAKGRNAKSVSNKPKPGGGEIVHVTHIKNPCQFAVQRDRDITALKNMSRNLNNWGNSPMSDREVPIELNPGELVIARYTADNSWYRARVKKVLGSNLNMMSVEVLYIDYGNSETVGMDRIKKMMPRFLKYPNFLMDCALFDIIPADTPSWSSEAIQTCSKMTEGRKLFMTVIREESDVLLVDLHQLPLEDIVDDTPISVRDALVFLELANFVSPSCGNLTGMPAKKREYVKQEPRERGQKFEAIVCHSGTPSLFYVQEVGENSECHYFAQLMKDMQEDYSLNRGDQLSIYCPRVGMVCCCKYSADQLWYRALVLELPGHKQVHVFYVDFGNEETVPYWRLNILLDKYLMLPPQAMKCTLADVEPSGPSQMWSQETIQWWSEKTNMKSFSVTVRGEASHSGMMEITLAHKWDHSGYTINGEMVTLEHANSTGPGSKPVPLEHCNQDHSSSESSSQQGNSKGSLASVSSSSSRSLTPTITPRASPRKQKASPPSVTSSSSAEYDLDKTPQATRVKTRKSPARDSKELKLDTEAASKEPSISKPSPAVSHDGESHDKEMVEVKLGYFASPSDFFLNMGADVQKLDKLMKDLEYYKTSTDTKTDWKKNEYCAALHPIDKRWYRASIADVVALNLVQVYLEDHGYKIDVNTEDLRIMKKEHLRRDKVGFQCYLSDILPAGDVKRWSRTACEFMQEEMKDKKLFIKMRGESEPGNPLPVDILLEEDIPESALEPSYKQYYSITDKLREKGLGIPRKKSKKSTIALKEEPKFSAVYSYPPPLLPIESSLVVVPHYVDFDAIFYVEEMGRSDVMANMSVRLHEKFANSEPHKAEEVIWEVRQACAAHFHLDNNWYRAQILQMEPHRAKVKYVDFGNVEFVGFDKLRADVQEFSTIPTQSFKCVLANTSPATEDGTWPKQVLDFMHASVVNQGCCMDIKVRYEDPETPQEVDLMLPDKRDLSTVLVQLGLAVRPDDIADDLEKSFKIGKVWEKKNPYKRPPMPPLGEYFPVFVTFVEAPDIVYFQHVRNSGQEGDERTDDINVQLTQLEKLCAELNVAALRARPLYKPRPGLPCCVQWSVDKNWYRGIVISVVNQNHDMLVLHADFGTHEVVPKENVKELDPVFTHLPAQGTRLKLYDVCLPKGEKSWSRSVLNSIFPCVLSKELTCCLKRYGPLQGDLYMSETKDWASLRLAYQDLIDQGVIQPRDEYRDEMPLAEPKINMIHGSKLVTADVIIEDNSDTEEDFA